MGVPRFDAHAPREARTSLSGAGPAAPVSDVRSEGSGAQALRLLTAARRLGSITLANDPSRHPVSLPEARNDPKRLHTTTASTSATPAASRQPTATATERAEQPAHTQPEARSTNSQQFTATPIRVLIADDQAMVRNGIRYSLEAYADITIVGEVETGEGALACCAQLAPDLPDVVLMDMMMPGMGGVATIATLEEQWPGLPIIALTSYTDGLLVEEALQAGAIGYLLKDVAVDDLAKAIRLARHGTPVLAPAAAQSLVREVSKNQPKLGQDLTEREREVLKLLAEGISNQEIAERLVITPATVKFHARSIRSKLGTTSRTETVVVAIQHHLVPMK